MIYKLDLKLDIPWITQIPNFELIDSILAKVHLTYSC